ncbi:unnamed protein product [Clavelina lepadiformis]|uniref:Uncharacterized protein n=1 Tax=Clavelina lepadiformis TaxID=159417 RepID=A0ABP0F734_CLALP
MTYQSTPSSIAPVPHSEALPVPNPPSNIEMYSSEDSATASENADTDASRHLEFSVYFHVIEDLQRLLMQVLYTFSILRIIKNIVIPLLKMSIELQTS